MKTRYPKRSASSNSMSGEDWVLAQTRARELAAAGRKAGLPANRTPTRIFFDLKDLVRRDGWTAWNYLTLGMLMHEVPDHRWRRGTCDPVVSYSIRELADELDVSTSTVRKGLRTLTVLGALPFERAPAHDGGHGHRYHIDLAPMIVLDAEVQREAREYQDELKRR